MSTPPPPPPPPPNEPFPSMGEDPFGNGDNDSGLSQGAPAVAASPGRVVLVLGILAVVVVFLLYSIFSGGDEEVVKETVIQEPAPAPAEPPPLPVIQPTVVAPPPFQPINIPEPTKVDLIRPANDGAEQQQRQARMRSKMIVQESSSGLLGGDSGGGNLDNNASATGTDANSQFAANVAKANVKADRVLATRIGDLRRTIAQGRLIQATTESAVNTELPAPIRAIVSRDTYGESGTEPLIPRGSRLIGSYNTAIQSGQSRVFVVWTRLIRPDGVDIMLNSPLVDQIGQAGMGGQVDSKFQQTFSRALMASVISIAFAIGSDTVSGGESSTSTTSLGTTQSGDGATTATINALNRLGSTTDSFLQKFIGVQPTILVDQGTPVNVFVNHDLVFPGDMAGTRVIQ